MPSIEQTLHTMQDRYRRLRATLPWTELEAEAARQGCSAADVFFDRAGRVTPGEPVTAHEAPARGARELEPHRV